MIGQTDAAPFGPVKPERRIPMPKISIIDTISDPGKEARPNEDRLCYNRDAAFVLDGATGLGDRQFMEGYGSDAAWMAEFAARRFAERLDGSADPKAVLRQVSEEARDTFTAAAGDQPRYAWPLCSLKRIAGDHIHAPLVRPRG